MLSHCVKVILLIRTTSAAPTTASHHCVGSSSETYSTSSRTVGENGERFVPLQITLGDKLREGGDDVDNELIVKEKQRALIDAPPLNKYETETDGAGWEEAEKQVKRTQARDGASLSSVQW